MDKISEHDIVELKTDLLNIPCGTKGTVLHIYPNEEAYVVEFILKDGTEVIDVKPFQIEVINFN